MKKKRGKASQQRIAQDLGVSQALVSLVLNGKRENISEESYRRIWNHALKIGYRPKGMKVSTTEAEARNVGFILRAGVRLHTQSNFFSHVQHGLHAGLLNHGYHSVFLGAEDDVKPEQLLMVIQRHQLAGLAVLGQVSSRFLKAIKRVQSNVVAVSVTYPGLCQSVMPNEKQAIGQLVSHLVELGHTEFAWIGGDEGLDYNLRRHAGLEEVLKTHGLRIAPRFSVDVDTGDRLAGWKAGDILASKMSKKTFPTACVCGNASMARGLVNCLAQKGWRIPEQISVVAVDATRICEEEHPQITGAHADPERIGRTAADLLMRSAEARDEILSDVILPSRLTIRETSAKPPQRGGSTSDKR
jgi:LacI family transcriptional regulator